MRFAANRFEMDTNDELLQQPTAGKRSWAVLGTKEGEETTTKQNDTAFRGSLFLVDWHLRI